MVSPSFIIASSEYFTTMGIPMMAGRPFGSMDHDRSAPVTVVSAALARVAWGDENAVGKRIRFSGGGQTTFPWMEVVGVAGDVRSAALGTAPRPTYYLLDSQFPVMVGGANRDVSLLVRTAGDPLAIASAARQAIWELDPELAIANVRPLEEVVHGSMARPRFVAVVLATFGAASLLLAVIGVYGVLSYAVTRRRREMGIRMALGAESGSVRRLVMRAGLQLAAIGIVLGLAVAFVGTSVMEAVLYEVSATDPVTFAAVAFVLALAALAASYLPAHRATKVHPAEVLRAE
jgi:putative ABC transport system permease protein